MTINKSLYGKSWTSKLGDAFRSSAQCRQLDQHRDALLPFIKIIDGTFGQNQKFSADLLGEYTYDHGCRSAYNLALADLWGTKFHVKVHLSTTNETPDTVKVRFAIKPGSLSGISAITKRNRVFWQNALDETGLSGYVETTGHMSAEKPSFAIMSFAKEGFSLSSTDNDGAEIFRHEIKKLQDLYAIVHKDTELKPGYTTFHPY